MSLVEKVRAMFGLQPKVKPDYIKVDLSNAVQRNEMAGEKARQALESMARGDDMARQLRQLTGKM